MDRLDGYIYGCSIYEELRLMFLELGLTQDITNYVGIANAREQYKNAIVNMNPPNLQRGVILYPLGDFNYKVTQVNSVFINYMVSSDVINQPYSANRTGIRQNLEFKINVLAQNYKDAEYISSLIHSKFYTHSGHKVFDVGSDSFSEEYLYSVASTGIEINKLVKVDLDHYTEYILSIQLHQVPVLFPNNTTAPPLEYGIFEKLYTYIDTNTNGYYELIV